VTLPVIQAQTLYLIESKKFPLIEDNVSRPERTALNFAHKTKSEKTNKAKSNS